MNEEEGLSRWLAAEMRECKNKEQNSMEDIIWRNFFMGNVTEINTMVVSHGV